MLPKRCMYIVNSYSKHVSRQSSAEIPQSQRLRQQSTKFYSGPSTRFNPSVFLAGHSPVVMNPKDLADIKMHLGRHTKRASYLHRCFEFRPLASFRMPSFAPRSCPIPRLILPTRLIFSTMMNSNAFPVVLVGQLPLIAKGVADTLKPTFEGIIHFISLTPSIEHCF